MAFVTLFHELHVIVNDNCMADLEIVKNIAGRQRAIFTTKNTIARDNHFRMLVTGFFLRYMVNSQQTRRVTCLR